MKKKLTNSLIILLLSTFLITSCAHNGFLDYNSNNYLQLYDYKSITCDYEYTQITLDDITTIIETEMSVNEAYIKINSRNKIEPDDIVLLSIDGNPEYYFIGSESYSKCFDKSVSEMSINESKNISTENFGVCDVKILGIYRSATIDDIDFILSYYNFSTFEELENFIRNRAYEEIIFNYAYDIIFENSSLISFPAEIENQIILDEKIYKDQILQHYSNFEDYLSEFEMTEEDFHKTISSTYYEIMLYKSILDRENIEISMEDISNYKNENKLYDYSDYEIYKEMAHTIVWDILISSVTILTN